MNKTYRLIRPAILLLLLAVSVLLACKSRDNAPAVITIAVPNSTSALPFYYLARNIGISGKTINITQFTNHAQALVMLQRGDIQFLYTGSSQGLQSYLDGSPLKIVGTGVWGLSCLMAREQSAKQITDLKGKRIALPFAGAPLDLQTRYILKQNGLDPDKDVQIVYSAFTQSVPLIVAGKVDCAAFPEPLATNLELNQGFKRLFDYQVLWAAAGGGDGLSPQVSLFTRADFAAANRPFIKQLVAGWKKATVYLAAHPAEAAALFAADLQLPAGVVEQALRHTVYALLPAADEEARFFDYFDKVKVSAAQTAALSRAAVQALYDIR